MHAISLEDKFSLFQEHWSPKVIAALNDYQVKLAKIQGTFVRHNHPETDELFLVVSGEMILHLDDRQVHLKAGELYVVPKGVYHWPEAQNECHLLLVEPQGVVNTGESEGNLTAPQNVWI